MSLNKNRNVGLMDSPRTESLQESQWMQQVTEAVRQGLGQQGDEKQKWLTWDDLEENKIVVPAPGPGGGYLPGEGGGGTEPPDMSPPNPLLNLEARGGMTAIRILWDDPNIHYYYRVEVHKSATDDLGEAFLVGTTQGNIFQDVVGSDETTWYYWARVIKQVGSTTIEGPWNKTQGTPAAASSDPDWILGDLEGKIDDSHLNDLLSGEIEKIPRIEIDIDDLETGLKTETEERQSEDESISRRIDTNVSRIGDNQSAIVKESETRATEDEALAKEITTLVAEVGDNRAAIQTESETRATEDEALASQITQLEAEVDGNFAGIRDEMQVIISDSKKLATRVGTVELDLDETKGAIEQQFKVFEDEFKNIRAEYTVKLDVDGYVGGFGLVNSDGVITALWRVDVFGIGSPGSDDLVFAVDAEEGRVVMDGAYIKTASINSAQIGELDVDRIVGGTADFVEANIRDASITNAKIGNVIRSGNYQAGTAGWIINKGGYAEFGDVWVRGYLSGSVIEGSTIIIGDEAGTVPTEADRGANPRYLTLANGFTHIDNGSSGRFEYIGRQSGAMCFEMKITKSISIPACNYTGEGIHSNGFFYNNMRRAKYYNINTTFVVEADEKSRQPRVSHDFGGGGGSLYIGIVRVSIGGNIKKNGQTRWSGTHNPVRINRGGGDWNTTSINIGKGNLWFHSRINYLPSSGTWNLFYGFDLELEDINHNGNSDLDVDLELRCYMDDQGSKIEEYGSWTGYTAETHTLNE